MKPPIDLTVTKKTKSLRAALQNNRDNIPPELKSASGWLAWRITKVHPITGKFNKIPVYATTGHNRHGEQGSPDDLANLTTFDAAMKALTNDTTLAGLGFATLHDFGVTALDADNCVNDGSVTQVVMSITDNTYAEFSPSGNGVRAFYLGTATDGKSNVDGFEVFSAKGFVTVTGEMIENAYQGMGMPLQRLAPVLRDKLEKLACSKPKGDESKAKRTDAQVDALVDAIRKAGLYERNLRHGKHSITCPFEHEHSDPDRAKGDGDTVILEAHYNGYARTVIECSHSHCAHRTQRDFLEAIGIDEFSDVFGAVVGGKSVQLLRGDTITPEAIEWLMPGWLALGKLILLAGSPGTGKTTLTMAMAAVVTTGGTWPDGSVCPVGNVVIWSGEDDPGDTLIPRLHACNADLQRVHFVRDTVDEEGSRPFDPSKDMPFLLSAVQQVGDVRLIVVDPIVSAVAGDSHKNAEVRRALQPLVDLASKIDAALVGITHFTKGTAGRDTTERVTGSLAFAALARIVLATARDIDGGDFLLTRSKSNIGADGGGWRYRMDQVDIPRFPGVVASRVVWGAPLEGSARELIGDAEGDTKDKTDASTVDGWLRNLLALRPMQACEVFTYGKSKDYSERRLQRALKKIGGISEKGGFQGQTWWRLPSSRIADAEGDPFDDGAEL